jgi:hypothetical protein
MKRVPTPDMREHGLIRKFMKLLAGWPLSSRINSEFPKAIEW